MGSGCTVKLPLVVNPDGPQELFLFCVVRGRCINLNPATKGHVHDGRHVLFVVWVPLSAPSLLYPFSTVTLVMYRVATVVLIFLLPE